MTDALFSLAGIADAECLAGDLHEEFAIRTAERGVASAAKWFAWQMLRCLAWPLAYRASRALLTLAPAALAMAWLWKRLFDHMCARPADGLLQVNILCLIAGAMLTVRSLRVFTGCLLCAGIALGLWLGPSAYPQIVAGLLAVPAGVIATEIRKAIAL